MKKMGEMRVTFIQVLRSPVCTQLWKGNGMGVTACGFSAMEKQARYRE
jgi:hypothetical protein